VLSSEVSDLSGCVIGSDEARIWTYLVDYYIWVRTKLLTIVLVPKVQTLINSSHHPSPNQMHTARRTPPRNLCFLL
jgi:hypothetical protein